jgi:hypothetical protein
MMGFQIARLPMSPDIMIPWRQSITNVSTVLRAYTTISGAD